MIEILPPCDLNNLIIITRSVLPLKRQIMKQGRWQRYWWWGKRMMVVAVVMVAVGEGMVVVVGGGGKLPRWQQGLRYLCGSNGRTAW